MVQEVENQDICVVSGGALVCGVTNNADGKPDVLQELALKIAGLGGPVYDAAFDRDSSDLRGILPAYLYRTDRVELLPAAGDPVLGSAPAVSYAGAGLLATLMFPIRRHSMRIYPAGLPPVKLPGSSRVRFPSVCSVSGKTPLVQAIMPMSTC